MNYHLTFNFTQPVYCKCASYGFIGICYNFMTIGNYYCSFNFISLFSEYLQTQLPALLQRPNLTMISWKTKIYQKITYTSPSSSQLDCFLECFILDWNNCTLFVFENKICYKGGMDVKSGSVQENYPSATMYYKKGNYVLSYLET